MGQGDAARPSPAPGQGGQSPANRSGLQGETLRLWAPARAGDTRGVLVPEGPLEIHCLGSSHFLQTRNLKSKRRGARRPGRAFRRRTPGEGPRLPAWVQTTHGAYLCVGAAGSALWPRPHRTPPRPRCDCARPARGRGRGRGRARGRGQAMHVTDRPQGGQEGRTRRAGRANPASAEQDGSGERRLPAGMGAGCSRLRLSQSSCH